MTTVAARPKAPPVTLVLAVAGVVAIIAGAAIAIGSSVAGIGLIVWGLIASMAVFRSRLGLGFMIAAIVLPLAIAWRFFLPVLAWLIVILAAARASKERLAAYYRPGSHEVSP